ncbi:unnamed protein product [Owenia fusiformis]|uniref:Methionine--tRNA ligase, cytoplasmic n=1 Tax=Owenia fusiformis TaxID=6347 RepID=A0A8S4MVI1_OWEFU|nr:unnamed protein product [Owenia fusiformis]
MKLYTNSGNYETIKILISGNISGQRLEHVEVQNSGEVKCQLFSDRFPVLEVSTSLVLQSPNAACRYVLAKGGKDIDDIHIDEWLEWESSVLKPSLLPYLVSLLNKSQVDNKLAANLQPCLQHIEMALKRTGYIYGASVTAADIVMWSTLSPLLSGKDTAAISPTVLPATYGWFKKMVDDASFKSAAQVVAQNKPLSLEVFKKSLLSLTLPTTGGVDSLSKRFKAGCNVASGQTKTNSSADEQETVPEKALTDEEVSKASKSWSQADDMVKPLPRQHPILPKEGAKNMLVTSALPYVNNIPHLGNIIGCVLSADVYSRFCRLRNYNVLYISGTDEYGTATETKAIEENLTPQQICDKYNKIHTEIYEWFNIDFDFFGRTTTKYQTEIAQDIFWQLHKNNFILKDTVEQLRCLQCERFLADRFVEGTCPFCAYEDARGDQCDKCGKLINAPELKQPKCKVCKNTPVVQTSEHLFLDLPKLEPRLSAYLDAEFEKGIWTSNTKVITKAWIRDGLKPRCITRDLKWGTPVPLEGFKEKVFYVWYDAPIGYMSMTANYTEQWKQWWNNPSKVQMYNFMAKDNVPFHSVIFPCCLLGAENNYTVVNNLSATEYLNYEDGKFSKSRGVGVFGNNARDTGIPADIWRFYLLFIRPESQDSTFNWDDFVLKNNSELLNNLGNFINRALAFLEKNFDSVIPEITPTQEDSELMAYITRELHSYIDNLEKIKIKDGLRNILSISKLGNQYIQAHKPWLLIKGSPEEKLRAGTVIGIAVNITNLISVLLQPYMPEVSKTIQQQLSAPDIVNVVVDKFVCFLKPGHKIGKPSPLFQKIEPSLASELREKFAGQSSKQSVSAADAERLSSEVAKQGDIVRELKSKGEKSQVDVEVKKLLELKKQLAAAQGVPETGGKKKKGGKTDNSKGQGQPSKKSSVNVPKVADPALVESLTTQVTQQGDTVRQLKASKAAKPEVDSAVAKLLDLKRQLAVAQGLNPDDIGAGGKKKKGKK